MCSEVHPYQGHFSPVVDLLGSVMRNAEGNGRRRNLPNASASNKNFAMTKRLGSMNVSGGRASMLVLLRTCHSPRKPPHRRDTLIVPTNPTLTPLLVLMALLEQEVVSTVTNASTAALVVMML